MVKPKNVKIIVWTRASGAKYGMMRFGGTHTNVSAEVDAIGPYSLGKGFRGYLVVSPKSGKTFVAEEKSGAFIGPSIESVKKDIAECKDIEFMKKQVSDAASEPKEMIPTEEFWSMKFGGE